MQLPENVRETARRYLDLLDRWNGIHSLTALPREDRFEELILDAWVLVPFLADLPPGARIIDFGSGMGIPALVLAMARPDLEVVALDKSRKKMGFVRQAALELHLQGLKAVEARAEAWTPAEAQLGVAKAVGSPALLAGWWERHGRPGAPLLALKSLSWDQEELPGPGWNLVAHAYRLPTRGERVILEMVKKTGP